MNYHTDILRLVVLKAISCSRGRGREGVLKIFAWSVGEGGGGDIWRDQL